MALLSTLLGLKVVGVGCGVDIDFCATRSPRPEAVLFTFSVTKHYHHFEVGRRLLFQQPLQNIPSFSLSLNTLMDSFRCGLAVDLMFRRLQILLGFAAVCHQLHERFLPFFARVIAEHRGIVGPQGGIRFHSIVDLHFDVEPQVHLLDSRLFLISSARHYEPIDHEDGTDHEEDNAPDYGEDDYDPESENDSEDDGDPEGQTEAEIEGGFGAVAASDMAIANIERVSSACVGAQDEGCSICFDEFEETEGDHSDLARLPCSHVFHYHCIAQWLERSRTCPLCRLEVK